MVMPESAEDVSIIAKLFNQHQCPFGMRSGSHTAFKHGNGIDNGVTVDFCTFHTGRLEAQVDARLTRIAYMNATTYDQDAKIASVQPGSTWGESYAALDEFGVVNIGGRASIVGVGGFTTGGGVCTKILTLQHTSANYETLSIRFTHNLVALPATLCPISRSSLPTAQSSMRIRTTGLIFTVDSKAALVTLAL
jgi:FAD/FMN-containing dehydrogenase